MSRLTRFTTTRLRNRLTQPLGDQAFHRDVGPRPRLGPSCTASPPAPSACPRPASDRRWRLRVEDGLHALLLAALHDAAVLGQVDRDALAGHHVVLAPHARVADQDDPLLGVVVLGAAAPCPSGSRAVTMRTLPVETIRTTPVALGVEVHLHAVGVLSRAVLGGDHVAREDDETFLLQRLELIGVDGDRARLRSPCIGPSPSVPVEAAPGRRGPAAGGRRGRRRRRRAGFSARRFGGIGDGACPSAPAASASVTATASAGQSRALTADLLEAAARPGTFTLPGSKVARTRPLTVAAASLGRDLEAPSLDRHALLRSGW